MFFQPTSMHAADLLQNSNKITFLILLHNYNLYISYQVSPKKRKLMLG